MCKQNAIKIAKIVSKWCENYKISDFWLFLFRFGIKYGLTVKIRNKKHKFAVGKLDL